MSTVRAQMETNLIYSFHSDATFCVSYYTSLLFMTITSPSHHHLTCKFLLYLYLQYESSAFSTNFYKKQIRKTN